jgi:hypothetical protein
MEIVADAGRNRPAEQACAGKFAKPLAQIGVWRKDALALRFDATKSLVFWQINIEWERRTNLYLS